RLNTLAAVWVHQGGTFVPDTSTALQSGMEKGIWDHAPAVFGSYSEPNPNTLLRYDSPMFMLTSGESNLLLAEAALRGWYAGSAAEAYGKGVRSAIKPWALYGEAGIIPDARIDQYLAENPFIEAGSFDDKLG